MDAKKRRAFLSGLAAVVAATLSTQAPAIAAPVDKASIVEVVRDSTPDFVIQPAAPSAAEVFAHHSHSSHSSHSSHDSHSSHSSHSSHHSYAS